MRRLATIVALLCLGMLASNARATHAGRDSGACEALGSDGFRAEVCLSDAPDVVFRRDGDSLEDFVTFAAPPPSAHLRYALRLPEGATVRVANDRALIADRAGRPRVIVPQPWFEDASGIRHSARLAATGCADGTRDPREPCGLDVTWEASNAPYPIVVDPEWTNLAQGLCGGGREMQTATLIDANSTYPGRILVVGGLVEDAGGNEQPTARVELVDPIGGTVSRCFALAEPRAYHTAAWVNLPTDGGTHGALLVVGGYNACPGGSCSSGQAMPTSSTYELYDPDANCSNVPVSCCDCPAGVDVAYPLPDEVARAEHTATVIPSLDNAVLVAGGTTTPATALLFYPNAYPSSNDWQPTSLDVGMRFGHTATFVPPPAGSPPGGAVLIVGGSAEPLSASTPVSKDLVYEPAGGASVPISHADAGLSELRPARSHTASLLDDSQVLLVGGAGTTQPTRVDFAPYFANPPFADGGSLPTWEPATPGQSVTLPTYSAAVGISGVPALHGALLVGGLVSGQCTTTPGTPYFNVNGKVWNATAGSLQTPRVNHTLTVANDGGTLVAIGGVTESGPCNAIPVSTIEVLTGAVLGDSCSADTDCVSGFCVAGVCCNGPCLSGPGSDTPCQGCSTGQCMPLKAGTPCASNACGATIECDGVNMSCGPVPACDAGSDAGPTDGGDGGPVMDATMDSPEDVVVVPEPNPETGPVVVPEASAGPSDEPKESLLSCAIGRPQPLGSLAALAIGPWVVVGVALTARRSRRRRGSTFRRGES